MSDLEIEKADLVIRLNEATGVGRLTCRKALENSNWNIARAMDWILEQVKSASRSEAE